MGDSHPQNQPTASTRRRAVPPANAAGCTSYNPGHGVHWMQALHTATKPEVAARSWPGRLLEVSGEVLTVERSDGESVLFRNHDPERLRAVARRLPSSVLVNDKCAILRIGSYCFSVQRDEGRPLAPCASAEGAAPGPAGDDQPAARLAVHKGAGDLVRSTPAADLP